MASTGDHSDSSSEYFSAAQSPSAQHPHSATPATMEANLAAAAAAAAASHSAIAAAAAIEAETTAAAAPHSTATSHSATAAAAEIEAETPAAAAPHSAAASHSAAAPHSAAAIGAEIPAAAAAIETGTETGIPAFGIITLLLTTLGAILAVYSASGHPRHAVRYSAYAVTGLLSLTIVLLVVGGWLRRPELINAGVAVVGVDVFAIVVFAWFVITG